MRHRAQRLSWTVLVLAVAVVATVLLGTPPADAHTVLRSSTPAAGSSGGAPAAVALTFDEPLVDVGGTAISVTGPAGSVGAGRTVVDGSAVRRELPVGLPAGLYTVAYRVVSRDGHPVSGSYRFTLAGPAPLRAGSAAPSSSAAAPEGPPVAVPESPGTPVAVWVVLGVLALATVGGGALLLRRPGASRP